jgi:hypothetical protein
MVNQVSLVGSHLRSLSYLLGITSVHCRYECVQVDWPGVN